MTAAFGNRQHQSCEFTSFYSNASAAPVTYTPGNAVKQAYFHTQHHARVLLCQAYPFNIRDFGTDLATKRSVLPITTDYVGVAQGRINIPRETTHLTAYCTLLPLSLKACKVTHRLILDTGSNCDSGSEATEFEETVLQNQPGTAGTMGSQTLRGTTGYYPFVGGGALTQCKVTLTLSNVSTASDGTGKIRLSCNMLEIGNSYNGDGYNTAARFAPIYYIIRAEMRY